MKLREDYVPLPGNLEGYRKWVRYIENDQIRFADLGRYLAFEFEAECRATEQEIRHCLPTGLPLLMEIDKWHQRPYHYYPAIGDKQPEGSKPSSYETFQLIAEVLETGDPSRYQPTLPTNTHWSNWPNAGGL